ncbi:MAG: tripartite tricarboxylate transporter substrate binding protein [Betaproteobacteria bacterium]|nr:tripartite tricarboxylate transporter substrate binding protein [Betaproteobacteria bacterium]
MTSPRADPTITALRLLRTCAALLSATLALPAIAAPPGYPAKPIRIVVPYAPGGGGDIIARMLGARLTESLGQQVVVDNRPGGGTIIGSEIVARATPDGYTLLINTAAHTINPGLHAKLPFDALRDFAPVILIALLPNVLVAHPALPANSVRELIALAKARPGSLNYASSGTGTAAHLAGELFRSMAGIEITHVPYKGGGAVMPDLIAGHVQLTFATMPSSIPHVKAGKLKALAVATVKRSSAMPQLPTIAEAGLPGYDASNWIGMLAPSATPGPVIATLNGHIARAVQLPDVRERMLAQGFEPATGSPEAFGAVIRRELPKWRRVITESGARPD